MTLSIHLRPLPIFAATAAALWAMPAGAQECTARDAVYAMSNDEPARLTLEHPDEPVGLTDLTIVVKAGEPEQRFEFSLTQSNGYGNHYAIPLDENLSEDGLLVFFFEKDGDRLVPYAHSMPASSDPAPDAIFMPQLGYTLWYGTNVSKDAVSIPTQIWYLAECPNRRV